MNYYERYKKSIQNRIAKDELTQEFVTQTTERLNYYLRKKAITQDEYNELMAMMNPNIAEE